MEKQDKTVKAMIARIKEMEACFDGLRTAFSENPSVMENDWFREQLRFLTDYYEGGLWLADYTADEQGLLPPDLKRGVLSEDGVWNFLAQIDGLFLREEENDENSISSHNNHTTQDEKCQQGGKRKRNRIRRADMHTHSEWSHDSTLPIEAMLSAQKEKGTDLFAVTDHFDTASWVDYDVFARIKSSTETAVGLKEAGRMPMPLLGIEISEGFWYPEVYQKVMGLADYDVILGSVHCVKYKELTKAYSGIDFSLLPRDVIMEYLDAYFDDMMTMIEKEDFDVLSHLTCPFRYINGIYKRDIDERLFENRIETIVEAVISRGIALEVNTSSYRLLGESMPSRWILERYYTMGGRLLTLGSDAHTAEGASADFAKAEEMLRKIGFSEVFYYQNRKAVPIEL